MGTAQKLNLVITFIIGVCALISLSYIAMYLRLKKKYGNQNAKRMFAKKLRIPFLMPKANGKKYKNLDALLISAAVDMKVETFYIIKYMLAVMTLTFGLLIHLTNDRIKINTTLQNMNITRNIYEYSEYDESFVSKEIALVSDVRKYLKDIDVDISGNYQQAIEWLESRIVKAGMTTAAETAYETAERILQKALYIEDIGKNFMPYLYILLVAVLIFNVPEILVVIKMTLVERNKDWEILNCMLVYSTMSSLPVCRVETIIDCMREVSRIYGVALERFKSALTQNNSIEAETIINTVKENDFQEILETLVIATEIGVGETTENIDDMLENKVKWLEINAIRNRQIKFAIAIVPVFIVLFLLFMYMMEGLNIMNYALQIEF